MVSKEEVKEVLRKEKVKAIYDSIDTKELDRLEQESVEYDEYTKKEYHPISYQVNKEIEEWEKTAPIFQEFDMMKIVAWGVGLCISFFFLLIGALVLIYAIASP
tara:strand:- start:215 stop:526 length:312 start_codon:yes stop_codon:yes gene_type:complete